MARGKIRRYDQDTLDVIGKTTPHKFQNVAVEALLSHRWRVALVKHQFGYGHIVVLRHSSNSDIGVAVYPDGSFARSKTPTVKWEWSRVKSAAASETPDPYVANILAGNAPAATIKE